MLNLRVDITNQAAAITASTLAVVDKIVRKATLDVEAQAKANAPVDTGALRASIFSVTSAGSDFAEHVGEAQGMNPDMTAFPEPALDEPLAGLVAVAADYGLYVEMGTVKSPAQPFLEPACVTVFPEFEKAVAQAVAQGLNP